MKFGGLMLLLYCRAPPNHNLDRFNHTEVQSPLWVYRDFNMLKRIWVVGHQSVSGSSVNYWYLDLTYVHQC